MYLSASLSIDKTTSTPPMRMVLSYDPKSSTDIGHVIINTNSKENNSKEIAKFKPKVYELTVISVGSNAASFLCTVS
jgi:hypothetical protein